MNSTDWRLVGPNSSAGTIVPLMFSRKWTLTYVVAYLTVGGLGFVVFPRLARDPSIYIHFFQERRSLP